MPIYNIYINLNFAFVNDKWLQLFELCRPILLLCQFITNQLKFCISLQLFELCRPISSSERNSSSEAIRRNSSREMLPLPVQPVPRHHHHHHHHHHRHRHCHRHPNLSRSNCRECPANEVKGTFSPFSLTFLSVLLIIRGGLVWSGSKNLKLSITHTH